MSLQKHAMKHVQYKVIISNQHYHNLNGMYIHELRRPV